MPSLSGSSNSPSVQRRFSSGAVIVRGVAVRLGALALALLGFACGASGPKLHPARGKVLFLNAPAEGAVVVLHPLEPKEGPALTPSGTAGADGTFTLRTHPHGEGAPAGKYRVLITWFPPNAREIENPKNKLPAKYSSSESPLQVTIENGPNELKPFALTR